MPISTEKIYKRFLSTKGELTFQHGHSYCANPLAVATAVASLELFAKESCLLKRQRVEQQHRAFLSTISDQPMIAASEVVGTILRIEYATKEKSSMAKLNIQISRFLIQEKGIHGGSLRQYAYLLVTYAIEARAEKLYPLYQKLIKKLKIPISVFNIIKEEAHHLDKIIADLKKTPAFAWREVVCSIEESLFKNIRNIFRKNWGLLIFIQSKHPFVMMTMGVVYDRSCDHKKCIKQKTYYSSA